METIKVMNPKISKWQTKAVEATPFCVTYPQKISPKLAEIYLRNNSNRKLKPSRITQLMRDIKKGKFRITNDIISFDKQGKLLNGQHRLTACVKSKKPIIVFVGFGYTKAEQAAMDGGVSRTLHDVAVLDGIEITAAESSIARFTRGQTITGNIPKRATRQEETDFIQRHYEFLKETGELLDGKRLIKSERTGFKFGNDIGSAFFRALIFYKDDPAQKELIHSFANALLNENEYADMSYQYSIQGAEIAERNRGFLVRSFRKYIDESRQLMRNGGQDQGGRDAKYKMTERYIKYFINPPKTLMKIPFLKRYDNTSELFLLPEEIASIATSTAKATAQATLTD